MMCKLVLVIVLYAVQVKASARGEEWVSRARVVGAQDYFINVMQEFGYELERREWCNLKLIDIDRDLNIYIANWNITGTVKYTNGFVISIQKIDIANVVSSITRTVQDDVVYPVASVRGDLHFRDINIGYDVIVNLMDNGVRRYTGEILNNDIDFRYDIRNDILTNVTTVTSSLMGISGRFIQMIFRPSDNITEVLSRNFGSSDNWYGAASWNPLFVSILTDIVNNKIEFPKICFNDDC